LPAALRGPLSQARKVLKKFPGIAEPGADRILLFARIAPVAAVPSNCPQVLSRILHGREQDTYRANYRESQEAIAAQVPETSDARRRAYLLLKRHGQELCKRTKPWRSRAVSERRAGDACEQSLRRMQASALPRTGWRAYWAI
jgi:endonuclease III